MGTDAWRMAGGFIRVIVLYATIKAMIWVTSFFDSIWNEALFQPIFNRKFLVLGFFLSFIVFYVVGVISETRWGTWIDKRVFAKIPIFGHFFVTLNPQVRKVFRNANGALIARFQNEWAIAFLVAVHKTKEGYLGSVGFLGLPPIPIQLDHNSRVKVRQVEENGVNRLALIHRDIAIQQVFTFGSTVPSDAYLDVVEVSFEELIRSARLFE